MIAVRERRTPQLTAQGHSSDQAHTETAPIIKNKEEVIGYPDPVPYATTFLLDLYAYTCL